VLRLDIAVIGGKRHALSIGDGLLKFGRQLVETHGGAPCGSRTLLGKWARKRRFQAAFAAK
jgi:hypothetical protein